MWCPKHLFASMHGFSVLANKNRCVRDDLKRSLFGKQVWQLTANRTCEDVPQVLQEAAPELDSLLHTGGAGKSAAPEEPIHEPQAWKVCCRG